MHLGEPPKPLPHLNIRKISSAIDIILLLQLFFITKLIFISFRGVARTPATSLMDLLVA